VDITTYGRNNCKRKKHHQLKRAADSMSALRTCDERQQFDTMRKYSGK
jgi:hypothetical protein